MEYLTPISLINHQRTCTRVFSSHVVCRFINVGSQRSLGFKLSEVPNQSRQHIKWEIKEILFLLLAWFLRKKKCEEFQTGNNIVIVEDFRIMDTIM